MHSLVSFEPHTDFGQRFLYFVRNPASRCHGSHPFRLKLGGAIALIGSDFELESVEYLQRPLVLAVVLVGMLFLLGRCRLLEVPLSFSPDVKMPRAFSILLFQRDDQSS
jgi:hypothetical protein